MLYRNFLLFTLILCLSGCKIQTTRPAQTPAGAFTTLFNIEKIKEHMQGKTLTFYGSRRSHPSSKAVQFIKLPQYGNLQLDTPNAIKGLNKIKPGQYLTIKGTFTYAQQQKNFSDKLLYQKHTIPKKRTRNRKPITYTQFILKNAKIINTHDQPKNNAK